MKNSSAPLLCALSILGMIFAASLANSGDWSQWRGPTRSGHPAEGEKEITSLPAELNPAWKLSIGPGFSSPVISAGKLVYVDEQEGQEVVHLIDTQTGKEQWKTPFSESFQDEWGAGPRSTPIIDNGRVYVQSCSGELACLDFATGKKLWGKSFERDFGVKFLGSKAREGTASRRGNNGSGIIAGDRLIVPVGNTNGASLVCLDKNNGAVRWQSGNDEAAYSSFMTADIGGTPQVVAFTADALLGAALENGKILWRVPLKTNAKRHAATPVVIKDHVLVNSHTFGLVSFKVSRDSGGWEAREAWKNKDLKINLATPVVVDGHLYVQGANKDYVCVDAATGETKWSQQGFGQGRKDYSSTIVTGKNLLVLSEEGNLLLLKADPAKYTELGRLQVCGNTWSFPALSDGKLYVRDMRQLMRLDLAK